MTRCRTPIRQKLFDKQHGKCFYCECLVTMESDFDNTLTIDHKHARVNGGNYFHKNIVGACSLCNNVKDIMSVKEFMEFLLTDQYNIEINRRSRKRKEDIYILSV